MLSTLTPLKQSREEPVADFLPGNRLHLPRVQSSNPGGDFLPPRRLYARLFRRLEALQQRTGNVCPIRFWKGEGLFQHGPCAAFHGGNLADRHSIGAQRQELFNIMANEMVAAPELLNPRRSAHASIRGYLYQTCLGVERWLDLEDGEALLCEGDEDLDRLVQGGEGRVLEQVKLRSSAVPEALVLESLRNFLCAFQALSANKASALRFVFLTNAPASKKLQKEGLLALWGKPERHEELIADLRAKLPVAGKVDEEVAQALVWVDEDTGRWGTFLDAVKLTFKEEELPGVRRRIGDQLADREDARALLPDHAETLTDRLVQAVLDASSRPKAAERLLTRGDLADLLRETAEQLSRWAGTASARALRRSFDEVAELGRLLEEGTRELPALGESRELPPGKLLTAAYEVIPFTSREAELGQITAWCEAPPRESVWLWTGEGGMGKTRLAIEACARLRHAAWVTGFLSTEASPEGLERLLEGHLPRLVVVDFAETRLAQVRPLLRRLAKRPKDHSARVRLLLLARRGGDWWNVLPKEDEAVDDLLLPAPKEPFVLSSMLWEPEERTAAFAAAVEVFARAQGQALPDAMPEPKLSEDVFERPLYLHMAALGALEGEALENSEALLAFTLDHERRFWWKEVDDLRNLSEPQGNALKKAMEQAVTALTLTQGAAEREAQHLLRAVTGDGFSQELFQALLELLARLYSPDPKEDGRSLDPLQPDLLGEYLVFKVLQGEEGLLLRVVDATSSAGHSKILRVLTRLAKTRSRALDWLQTLLGARLEEIGETALEVAVEVGDPLGVVLARQVAKSNSFEVAKTLATKVNSRGKLSSVHLVEVGLEATRSVIGFLREGRSKYGETWEARLADHLQSLSHWLSTLGQHEAALDSINEALKTYQRIVDSGDISFTPRVAMCLNDLSLLLLDSDRNESALEAIKHAVALYRGLPPDLRLTFQVPMARSLDSLSFVECSLDRHEEALEASLDSLNIFKKLADSGHDIDLFNLAASLSNYGNRLAVLGHRKESLEATQKSVEHFKLLYKKHPSIYQPGLAKSLENLGLKLAAVGDFSRGIRAIQEAVVLSRELATWRSETFLPDLARTLRIQGILEAAVGRWNSAFETTQKAVDLYRQLAQTRPDAFRPDLAMSLNNLGNRLSKLGRREDALQATQEAVDLYRQLAQTRPDAFRPAVASSLNDLGTMLSELGRREDALEAAEEACRLLTPFFLKFPAALAGWMEIMAGNYVRFAEEAGQEPDPELLAPIEEGFRALQAADESED